MRRRDERATRDRLQELELRCDGFAVISMVGLRVDPEQLVSAATKLARYNERMFGKSIDPRYVPLDQRIRFIRSIAKHDRALAAAADGLPPLLTVVLLSEREQRENQHAQHEPDCGIGKLVTNEPPEIDPGDPRAHCRPERSQQISHLVADRQRQKALLDRHAEGSRSRDRHIALNDPLAAARGNEAGHHGGNQRREEREGVPRGHCREQPTDRARRAS